MERGWNERGRNRNPLEPTGIVNRFGLSVQVNPAELISVGKQGGVAGPGAENRRKAERGWTEELRSLFTLMKMEMPCMGRKLLDATVPPTE